MIGKNLETLELNCKEERELAIFTFCSNTEITQAASGLMHLPQVLRYNCAALVTGD